MTDSAGSTLDGGPSNTSSDEHPDIEANIKNRSTWQRLLFMLVVGALYALSRPVVFAVVTLQFFWVLLSGEKNDRLATLGHSLALYTAESIDYLSYVTEERPFPFDKDWP